MGVHVGGNCSAGGGGPVVFFLRCRLVGAACFVVLVSFLHLKPAGAGAPSLSVLRFRAIASPLGSPSLGPVVCPRAGARDLLAVVEAASLVVEEAATACAV